MAIVTYDLPLAPGPDGLPAGTWRYRAYGEIRDGVVYTMGRVPIMIETAPDQSGATATVPGTGPGLRPEPGAIPVYEQ